MNGFSLLCVIVSVTFCARKLCKSVTKHQKVRVSPVGNSRVSPVGNSRRSSTVITGLISDLLCDPEGTKYVRMDTLQVLVAASLRFAATGHHSLTLGRPYSRNPVTLEEST